MQYRVQFLDRSGAVVREFYAYARTVADAMQLVIDLDWPSSAVRLRVVDADGREVGGREQ